MNKFLLFLTAVFVLYFGGFIYDEVGPLVYAVVITIIASSPLLLKTTFWKKIILMVPLLVLRVVGKVFLSIFGKNAFSKLLAKYGLLERRFKQAIEAVMQSKDQSLARWKSMSRPSQAYLLLIFFPVVVVILLLMLVIEIIRLRFLQFIIEKLMHSYLMKWTVALQPKITEAELAATDQKPSDSANDNLSFTDKSGPEQKSPHCGQDEAKDIEKQLSSKSTNSNQAESPGD